MKPGREVLLPDLKDGMRVLLEAVAPPEPLYLLGFVQQIEGQNVRVRMSLGISNSYISLRANGVGHFFTKEHRPVRVFKGEASK